MSSGREATRKYMKEQQQKEMQGDDSEDSMEKVKRWRRWRRREYRKAQQAKDISIEKGKAEIHTLQDKVGTINKEIWKEEDNE